MAAGDGALSWYGPKIIEKVTCFNGLTQNLIKLTCDITLLYKIAKSSMLYFPKVRLIFVSSYVNKCIIPHLRKICLFLAKLQYIGTWPFNLHPDF